MRGRVYPRLDGRWEARWGTCRVFATEEEARAAAEQPLPPPTRGHAKVSDEVAALALRCHENGIAWSTIAAALTLAGVETPKRRPRWSPMTVKSAALRLRARRDEADAAAVRAEHYVEEGSQ